MFSVYCSWHEAEVLLGAHAIEAIHKDDKGFAVRWRCTCGNTGIHRIDGPRTTPPPVEVTAC